MKKYLLFFTSAALLLVGCAKEQIVDLQEGGLTNVTFTANLDNGVATKAAVDGDGAGAKVNRCIMEIYFQDQLYTRLVQPVTSATGEAKAYATFANVPVVAGKQYQVLFWADCGGVEKSDLYYTTTSLKSVTVAKTAFIGALVAGDNDKLDAFFFADNYTVSQNQTQPFAVTLKRPFAQLNIITTDVGVGKTVFKEELLPEKVSVSYKADNTINVATGEISKVGNNAEDYTFTYEASVYGAWNTITAQHPELTLSMDYLLASTDKSAIDVTFKTLNGSTEVMSHSLTNLPYQRNYRTNVKGALLTTTGDWVAEIESEWNKPDKEEKVVEAGSVAAANEAFANGATNVKITSVGEETTLYLPQTTKEVTIDFANPSQVVTVNYGPAPTKAAGDKPDVVNIATNDVTKFTVTGINNIVWLAGNQVALANALNNAVAGQTVALANDITMTENWVSVARGSNTPNFDGRNHAIINMTIKTQEESYAGLFSTIGNHVILQNVTFRNALIDIPASVGDDARGGILVGHMYPCDVINCHVEGATIKAHQKMGGLIGYVEGDAANKSISIKDCSVKDITLSSNVQGSKTVAGVGGLIGHLVLSQADLITVENNSVENIIITDSKPITGSYNWDEYGQYLPHAFVGNACQNYKGGEPASESKHSIVLMNNRILGTNTELSTCIYSSEYFGWGGNAEEMPSWTGKIYIDGQEWTPNYPVKIVGGKGYATLNEALTAATAGQTVQILKAGDYTVETLSTKAAVVEATVDGVVFNHPTAATSWVASCQGTTIKNVTWNVGNAHHQYIQNTNLENCTVNGLLCTHSINKFKDCTFINEEGYNFWVYGNEYTEFDNCTFTCPGKNDGVAGCGSALNCYNEGAQTPTPVLVVKNCTFTAKEASNKYSAIYIKPETAFDIQITNSTCNDKFCTGAISGSKLWNLKSDREGTTVSIDGNLVYPFCSKDADGNYHIINAAGLLQFHDLYADGKVAYTAKVYIDNDIDFTGKTWNACEWHADKTTKGFALFDGQNHTIKNFTVSGQGMFSRWACTANIGATPYFKDIVFDGAKNVTSTLNVSLFCGQVYQNAKIENVTIKNSQFEGTYKVAPFVGTVYDENATGPTLTLKDCKVENTTVRGTSYDFDICGMVAWVNEKNNDKIAFEGNNVVEDVTLFTPGVTYNQCAKIYHNGETAYDEATNVTVTNVNVVNGQ